MKLKYLLGLIVLLGMTSCDNEALIEDTRMNEKEIRSRSTSSAIPLVEALEYDVTQLLSDGLLSTSMTNKILIRLDKVKIKLEQGNADQAINKLNKLIDYIILNVAKGKIDATIGDSLVIRVHDIITEVSTVDSDNDGYSAEDDCDDSNANINPSSTTGQVVFDAITAELISDQPLGSIPVNGDDNETNLLTVDAIVLYKTNQGRFGKLMVNTYGYTLNIQYVTFDYDGSVFTSSADFDFVGTATIDFDLGVTGEFEDRDLWWQQIDDVERDIFPLDNVAVALFVCN